LVGLASADGRASWQLLGPARPDVPGAYAFTLAARDIPAPTVLAVQTPDGVRKSVPVAALSAGKSVTLNGGGIVGIDGIEASANTQRADARLPDLAAVYVVVGYSLCLLIVAATITLLLRGRRGAADALIVLSLAAIGARIVLLAILDASSWNGAQPRYIMPLLPFFACAGILSLVRLSETMRTMSKKKPRTGAQG
jgi:hypothetical protein